MLLPNTCPIKLFTNNKGSGIARPQALLNWKQTVSRSLF